MLDMLFSCICAFLLILNPLTEAKTPDITVLHIKSDIKYRYATTLVTSKVVNIDNVAREAFFDVTLPNEAFITKFQLKIDGKTIDGEVKEKKEARQQFESAKSRGQSAGIIKTKPRETNKFNIQVNVAAAAEVTFILTYQELLRRKKGLYHHSIYIDPGQIVKDFRIDIDIEESRNIVKLSVPNLKKDGESTTGKNDLAKITRSPTNPKIASVSYSPTEAQQKVINATGLFGQFVVEYDVTRDKGAGDMLMVNGYFVHFFAPEDFESFPMDVIFVLDKSGSMGGKKILQLREAMTGILDDMRAKDRFSIVTFDSSVNVWGHEELIFADRQNIKNAKSFSNTIYASGGTNIYSAIEKGLSILTSLSDITRAPVLIFLTDGQATSGITNRDQILKNIDHNNTLNVPIFSLAFGTGADYDFVKKISGNNNGFARKIYEDSDAAIQIKGFYEEISTVIMRNIQFKYVNSSVFTDSVTKDDFNTYFDGTELVVAGKLKSNSDTSAPVTVSGTVSYGTIEFPKPLIIRPPIIIDPPIIRPPIIRPPIRPPVIKPRLNEKSLQKIVEKLWAYLTVKQLLRKKEASTSSSEKANLDKQILQKSLKYQFVTPLTSMVVTLPNNTKTRPVEPPIVIMEDSQTPQFRARTAPSFAMSQPKVFGFAPQASLSLNSKRRFSSARKRARVGPSFGGSPLFSTRGFRGSSLQSIGSIQNMPGPPPTTTFTLMSTTTTTTTATTTTTDPRFVKSSIQSIRNGKVPPFPSNRKLFLKTKPPGTKAEWKPNFIVKVDRITDPLCMDLNFESGATYKLFEDIDNDFKLEAAVAKIIINSKGQFSSSGSGGKLQINDLKKHENGRQTTVSPTQFLLANSPNIEIQAIPNSGVVASGSSYFQIAVEFKSGVASNIGGVLAFFKGFKGSIKLDSTSTKLSFDLQKGSNTLSFTAMKELNPRAGVKSCWYIDKQSVQRFGLNMATFKV